MINFQELKYHAYLYLLIHNLNGKLFGLLKIYKELFCLQKKHYQSNLFQTHTIHPLNQLAGTYPRRDLRVCVRWPVREGMKTIRQIADEIGVSKQAVYKRYKGKLYTVCAPYAHTEQGVLYLSEQAETLIKQDFLRDGCPNGSHTDTHTERSIGAVPEQSQEAGVVAILQATIDTLQGQLSVKDKQIEELNARLAEVTSALVVAQQTAQAAQALHAGTIRQQLTDGEDDPNQQGQTVEQKKSWFSKVFGGR